MAAETDQPLCRICLEEEDDSFGSAGEGGRLGRERIGLGGLAQEGGKRKGAETASGGFEKLAAVRDHVG